MKRLIFLTVGICLLLSSAQVQAQTWSPAEKEVVQAIDALGLRGMHAIAIGAAFDGPAVRDMVCVLAPGERGTVMVLAPSQPPITDALRAAIADRPGLYAGASDLPAGTGAWLEEQKKKWPANKKPRG